jgi:hypothetical protein
MKKLLPLLFAILGLLFINPSSAIASNCTGPTPFDASAPFTCSHGFIAEQTQKQWTYSDNGYNDYFISEFVTSWKSFISGNWTYTGGGCYTAYARAPNNNNLRITEKLCEGNGSNYTVTLKFSADAPTYFIYYWEVY